VLLEGVEQRLARMLLTLTDKIGHRSGTVTQLSITRQELADMIGTTVETTMGLPANGGKRGSSAPPATGSC